MENAAVEMFAKVWAGVALGLSVYLVLFPLFMHRKIAQIIALLERIAGQLEKKTQ